MNSGIPTMEEVAGMGKPGGDTISEKTLEMCDKSAENMKHGNVGEPIELDKYIGKGSDHIPNDVTIAAIEEARLLADNRLLRNALENVDFCIHCELGETCCEDCDRVEEVNRALQGFLPKVDDVEEPETESLWCINRNPDDVSIDWIRKNSSHITVTKGSLI